MTFRNILLPTGFDLAWSSASEFSTDVLRTDSGRESRNQNWDGALGRYALPYNAKNAAQWEEIDAFIHTVAGRAYSFKLRDPRHNVATTTTGKFVSGQAVLRHTFGAYTFDKVVTKLDATVVLTGGGTVDLTTGEVLTGSPSAWMGPFYICARFDTDELHVTGVSRDQQGNLIARFDDVPIVEVLDE